MKSDMPKNGTYVATPVGWNLYVWSRTKGKPGNDACVISSHGSTALISNEKERSRLPSGATVVFYGPHAAILQAPDIHKIAVGRERHYERVRADQLGQDYELSKAQGTHRGEGGVIRESQRHTGESYRFLGEEIHDYMAYQRRVLATFSNKDEILKQNREQYESELVMDFVTVRYRKVFRRITLFEVINSLWSHGFRYAEFHCAFCRVEWKDGEKPVRWNTSENEKEALN